MMSNEPMVQKLLATAQLRAMTQFMSPAISKTKRVFRKWLNIVGSYLNHKMFPFLFLYYTTFSYTYSYLYLTGKMHFSRN